MICTESFFSKNKQIAATPPPVGYLSSLSVGGATSTNVFLSEASFSFMTAILFFSAAMSLGLHFVESKVSTLFCSLKNNGTFQHYSKVVLGGRWCLCSALFAI